MVGAGILGVVLMVGCRGVVLIVGGAVVVSGFVLSVGGAGDLGLGAPLSTGFCLRCAVQATRPGQAARPGQSTLPRLPGLSALRSDFVTCLVCYDVGGSDYYWSGWRVAGVFVGDIGCGDGSDDA